jgi:hypothetical protein
MGENISCAPCSHCCMPWLCHHRTTPQPPYLVVIPVAPTTSQPRPLAYTHLEPYYRLSDFTFPAISSFPSCTCHPDLASCHPHLPNLTVTLPAQCHHPCLSGLTVALVPPYSLLHLCTPTVLPHPLPSHLTNLIIVSASPAPP